MRELAFLIAAAGLVFTGGCSNPTTSADNDVGNSGTDSGHSTLDSGSDSGHVLGTDSGADSATVSMTDSAVDTGGAIPLDSGLDGGLDSSLDGGLDARTTAMADVGADAGMGCLFVGRYTATNIRCNGAPYTGAGSLTPPGGSWIAADDGTHATFTETIGSCSLIATGHIDCDSPTVGQFTHVPTAPLRCSPAACSPFAALCSGTTVGASATWTYTRNADGTIETSTSSSAIHTCTSGATPQGNPLQITWVPMGA